MRIPIMITQGKDKGKKAHIIKYIGDEAWRCVIEEGEFRTLIYEGEYEKLN